MLGFLLLGMALGGVKVYNEKRQNNEIIKAALMLQNDEIERKRYLLTEELNAIDFQLDLLCRIETVQHIDISEPLTEKELKKALETQRKIHTLLKRKNTLEYKLTQL